MLDIKYCSTQAHCYVSAAFAVSLLRSCSPVSVLVFFSPLFLYNSPRAPALTEDHLQE